MKLARAAVAAIVLCVTLLTPAPAQASNGWNAAFLSQDPWPTLAPGAVASYTIRFRNAGTQAWRRDVAGQQVNLAVFGDSEFFAQQGYAVGWYAPTRPATTTEAVVAPGGTATFTFSVRGPATGTSYRMYVHPVLEGVEHLEDPGAFLIVAGDAGFHSRWVSESPFPIVDPDQTTPAMTITFRNAGTRSWRRGVAGEQATLGINGDDRTLAAYGVSWPTPDRPAIQTEAVVAPGQNATFTFAMRGPTTPGTYQLHLRPVVDGVTWMEDEGVFMYITVRGAITRVPTLTATTIQSGLSIPWDLAFAPDGRMFVTERVGNLLVYASAAPNAAQLSNTAVASNIRASGEAGAMSIELDPAFAQNGLLYVCASVTDNGQWLNQVLRYRMNGNTPVLDSHVIRFGMLANSNHDGCRIRFGPDGKLWVTMGDAGNTANAQDPNALNGKVLRVNSDGTIPADNPVIAGSTGRSAIYTWGNRNPQGLTFEPGTGRPFEVEHGDSTHDEINLLASGANYGYPICRGPCDPRFVDPAWSSGGVTLATSGADFARGTQWGAWDGSLFVATLKESDLRRFTVSGNTATQREILYNGAYGRLRTVRQGPDGSLYLTTSNGAGDLVVRLTPN